MDKVYEINYIKTTKLTKEEQQDVQEQLNNISGDFNYIGYSKVSYAIDKKVSTQDNPILKIIKIEPIEGTIIDEWDKIMDKVDNVF